MDPSTSFLIAAPIVDVDNTLFVQIAIFVGLMAALNGLLFKPWLEVRARRIAQTSGAMDRSSSLRGEADALSEHYDLQLMRARDRAMASRSDRRKEAEAEQAKLVTSARNDASARLEAERSRLDQEESSARAALGGRVDALAEEITTKLLGRAS